MPQAIASIAYPFCFSTSIKKEGKRKNNLQTIQKYFCKICKKTFHHQKVKSKTFPLKVIIDGLGKFYIFVNV